MKLMIILTVLFLCTGMLFAQMAAENRNAEVRCASVDKVNVVQILAHIDHDARFEVRLFEDVKYTVDIVSRNISIRGSLTLSGKTVGSPFCNVVIVKSNGRATVTIHDVDIDRIFELDVNDGIGCAHEYLIMSMGDGSEILASDDELLMPSSEDGVLMANEVSAEPFVDILVVYDANAVKYVLSSGKDPSDFAETQIERMNIVLSNTSLSDYWKFRLKGVMVLSVPLGTDTSSVVSSVKSNAEIKNKRNLVDADIVSVFIDTGSSYGTTGTGYALVSTSRPSSFSEIAYNVCAIRAVGSSYTMSHEVGHNMGAGHAKEQSTDPGPQSYGYSSGYYFSSDGRRYCTIMAYESEGSGGTQVPYFSSPLHEYGGVCVGDADHDNTRALRNLYSYVTLFRKDTGSPFADFDHSVVLFSEKPAVVDMPFSLKLDTIDKESEIRYTTDGSDPDQNSPLYSGAIQLTDTTTVRAVVIRDGVAGSVYKAKYIKNDIGHAVNQPGWEWRHSDKSWLMNFSETHDGECSICSYNQPNTTSWIETSLHGPGKLSFWYKPRFAYEPGFDSSKFSLRCDAVELFNYSEETSASKWRKAEVEIPEGKHDIRFVCENGSRYYTYGFTGVYVDEISWTGPVLVTMDANGGDCGSSKLVAQGGILGDVSIPSRAGYSFTGWTTARNGGDIVNENSIVDKSMTLYAQWKPNTYRIRFNANGGKGAMQEQMLTYGVPMKLLDNRFVREGYLFCGWSRSRSGQVEFYDACQVQNLITDGVVDFYACWKRIGYYLANDDDVPMDASIANKYDGVIVDADGLPLGYIAVKAAKASGRRDVRKSKVAVMIQMTGEAKKVTIKGEVDVAEAKLVKAASDGRILDLMFSHDYIDGTFDGHAVEGVRNLLASTAKVDKGSAAKAKAEGVFNQLKGSYVMAYSDEYGYNWLSVSVMAKGKVKVSGKLVNGTTVSTSSQLIVGEEYSCIPVIYTKKDTSLAFNIYFANDGTEATVFGYYDAVFSPVSALTSGCSFVLDESVYDLFNGYELLGEALPWEVSVEQKGSKWIVAGGAKAGKVMYKRGTQEIDEAKLGDNPSGLKLTYKKADGSFKGSFKVYANVNGKLKATMVSVSGIVLNGVGYGTATVKGKGSVSVMIE